MSPSLSPRRVFGSVWADALLAVALLVLGQYEVWSGSRYDGGAVFPGPHAVNALAVVPLLALPLAFRRRAPLASFAIVLGTIGLASLAFGGAEATTEFVALLVSVYSATANAARRYAVLAAALLAGAIHELRDTHVHGVGDVVFAGGLVAVAWLFGVAVHSRYGQISALESETARLQIERDEQARQAVALERARLARELHDVVAHAVSVVVVQAQAGQRLVGRDDTAARQSLEAIEETARTALVEMRRLLGMLRAPEDEALTPQPGLDRIDELIVQLRDAGLPVSLQVSGEPVALAPGLDLSAYRVVQEGLTNALKHAGAATASVRIHYGPGRLELEVADDGVGGNGDRGAGHGLIGMRERVDLYGGAFESGPRPEGGWLLCARFPLETRR
jgi:signal transduction histidine kinase